MTIFGRIGVTPNYPSTIPGLVFQLDAASLSASSVASWSYGAGNVVQATSALQPVWTPASANVNGLPSVIYDATKVMATAALTTADPLSQLAVQDMTIATVMYLTSFPTQAIVVSKGVINGGFDFYLNSTQTTNPGRGILSPNITSNPWATGRLFSLIITIAGVTASVYANGVCLSTSRTAGMVVIPNTNPVNIGQRSDAGTKLAGEQPELLIVNRALMPIEIATLALFWNVKYNIAPGTF